MPRIVGFPSLVECFDEEEWTDNQIEKANRNERLNRGRYAGRHGFMDAVMHGCDRIEKTNG
jgi:hypothetical protein